MFLYRADLTAPKKNFLEFFPPARKRGFYGSGHERRVPRKVKMVHFAPYGGATFREKKI